MTEARSPQTAADAALLDAIPDIPELLDRMTAGLAGLLARTGRQKPLFVGIHTGGVWLAKELMQRLSIPGPLYEMDVSLYRDDYDSKGLKPEIRATLLPDSTAGRHIVLVDDVIMTGRTIRGAINQLFDYGRPASVMLVELLDLPARQLPVQADVVGHRLDAAPARSIKLNGPAPLRLELSPRSDGDAA